MIHVVHMPGLRGSDFWVFRELGCKAYDCLGFRACGCLGLRAFGCLGLVQKKERKLLLGVRVVRELNIERKMATAGHKKGRVEGLRLSFR